MTSAQAIAFPEDNLVGWERALYAFLVEKHRRSGSIRTLEGYSRMLPHFFSRVPRALLPGVFRLMKCEDCWLWSPTHHKAFGTAPSSLPWH
jgi:hypothetical protein